MGRNTIANPGTRYIADNRCQPRRHMESEYTMNVIQNMNGYMGRKQTSNPGPVWTAHQIVYPTTNSQIKSGIVLPNR